MKVVVGGVDYTDRLLDYSITLNDSWLGELVPNEATVVLNNTDNLFKIDNEGNVEDTSTGMDIVPELLGYIEIEGIRKFTGYVSKNPTFSVDRKQLTIKLQDAWWRFDNLYCAETVYEDADFLTVLTDIVTNMAGIDPSQLDFEDPGLTITYWRLTPDVTVKEALTKLAESVGGQLYFDEAGNLIFKAGFKSPFTTDTVDTLTVSLIKDLTLSSAGKDIDCVQVDGKKTILSNKVEPVWIGATEDEPLEVPPDGLPSDENDKFIAKFDKPVWWLCQLEDVILDAPSTISLESGTYQSNFYDYSNGILKNPEQVELKILNAGSSTETITDCRLFGKYIKQSEMSAIFPVSGGFEKHKVENELIQDENWAKDFAEWLYYRIKTHLSAEITVVDFKRALGYSVGDKVIIYDPDSNLSHRYVIHEINIKPGKVMIKVEQDFDAYTPGTKGINLKYYPVPKKVEVKRKLSSIAVLFNGFSSVMEAYASAESFAGFDIVVIKTIVGVDGSPPTYYGHLREFINRLRERNPNIYIIANTSNNNMYLTNDSQVIDIAVRLGLNGVLIRANESNTESAIDYAHGKGLDVWIEYEKGDVPALMEYSPNIPLNKLIPGKDGIYTSILFETVWSTFPWVTHIIKIVNDYNLRLILRAQRVNPDDFLYRLMYNLGIFFSADGVVVEDPTHGTFIISDMPEFPVDYRTRASIAVTDNDPQFTMNRISPLGEMTVVWDDTLTGISSFIIGNYSEYSESDGYKQLWNPLMKQKSTQWYIGLPGEGKYIAIEDGELVLANVSMRLTSGNSGFIYTPRGTYMFKGDTTFSAAYFWKNVELEWTEQEVEDAGSNISLLEKTISIDPAIPSDRLKYVVSLQEFRYLDAGEAFPIDSNNNLTTNMDLKVKHWLETNSSGEVTAIKIKPVRTLNSVPYTDTYSMSGTSYSFNPVDRSYTDVNLEIMLKIPSNQGTEYHSYTFHLGDIDPTHDITITITDRGANFWAVYSDWWAIVEVTYYKDGASSPTTLAYKYSGWSAGVPARQYYGNNIELYRADMRSVVEEERGAVVKLNVSVFVLSPY